MIDIDFKDCDSAFDMLDKCRMVMSNNGVDKKVINQFTKKAINSNYVDFLALIKEHFNLTN